ncbi:hypothetical protein 000TH008_27 [Bacillus phage 000TH008]|nr:hypothetical protein 000TH008_27 [Bacillus phage 000TH008]QQO40721.1 hypothetical protein 000TH009_27 [Bacillus phage 000TH009]QQO41243.1 hypothetical protein 015DV004_27 [Bacillus phage 015DV004]
MKTDQARTEKGTLVIFEAPEGRELPRGFARIMTETYREHFDRLIHTLECTSDISVPLRFSGIIDMYYDEIENESYLQVTIKDLL